MSPARLALSLLALAAGCFADNGLETPAPTTGEGTTAAPTTGSTGGATDATTGEPCSPDMPDRPWYLDQDDDGWGFGEPVFACEQLIGHVDRDGDCDDFADEVSPDAVEICNGRDDDCDGLRDEYSADNPTCDGCGLAERDGAPFWFCEKAGVDWLKAREDCMSFGAGVDLASVHSAEENQWIANLLGKLGLDTTPDATLWLGMRRPDALLATCEVTDEWIWSDGTPFDFKAWGPGQPDNNPTMDGCDLTCSFDQLNDADCPRENCLDWAGIGGWNDVSCHLAGQGFVCRGPAPADMSSGN